MKLSKEICIRCITRGVKPCIDKALVDSWFYVFDYHWDCGRVYFCKMMPKGRLHGTLVSHDDVILGRRFNCPYMAEHVVIADE